MPKHLTYYPILNGIYWQFDAPSVYIAHSTDRYYWLVSQAFGKVK